MGSRDKLDVARGCRLTRADRTLTTPTGFSGWIRVFEFAIWAGLPEKAYAARWLAQPSRDYYSEERRDRNRSEQEG
jgi:hypothetical protein